LGSGFAAEREAYILDQVSGAALIEPESTSSLFAPYLVEEKGTLLLREIYRLRESVGCNVVQSVALSHFV
jgi:hypothetical protein